MKNEKKKQKKFHLIGNLGNSGNNNNGQTVKTKTMIQSITERYGMDSLIISDTNRKNNSKLEILKSIFINSFRCDVIILSVCDFAILFLALPLLIVSKIRGIKICYVLIGGWLGEYVKEHKIVKFALKRYDKLFAETKVCGNKLIENGFFNIEYIDNCKYVDIENKHENGDGKVIKLCTLSRIVPEKGVEDAIEAIKIANKSAEEIKFYLDIYGEIDLDYKSIIEEKICEQSNYVQYKGVVEFEKCPSIINQYDALLFPTRVMTEGMPGTIIDAMYAGTPVIATEWNACKEMIIQNYNGIYYQGRGYELSKILTKFGLYSDLGKMRNNCLVVADRFKPDVAFQPLFNFLNN